MEAADIGKKSASFTTIQSAKPAILARANFISGKEVLNDNKNVQVMDERASFQLTIILQDL